MVSYWLAHGNGPGMRAQSIKSRFDVVDKEHEIYTFHMKFSLESQ